MQIPALSALKFIAVYKALLLEIDRTGHDGRKSDLIKRLVAARSRLSSDPSLIEQALAALKSKSLAVDPEVVASLRSLEVENWVFLRDTKLHSLFVHPSEHQAYGVLGLNDQIRDYRRGCRCGHTNWLGSIRWPVRLRWARIAYYLAWKKLSKQLQSRVPSDQVGGPVPFEIWVVKKFEEFPGDSFFPSAKVSLLAPCFVQAGASRYPPSNSIFLFFPWHRGKLVETFYKPVKIEGFILF
jgi:hypothetical protein